MKKIVASLLVLAIAALGLGFFLYSNLDALAKRAIEEVGSAVLDVPVRVGGVSLSPADGTGALTDFTVGNPAGFKMPNAMTAGHIELAIEPKSLATDVIHINRILASTIAVSYESGSGGTNFDAIKRNAESHLGKADPNAKPKKLIVDSLVISDVRMTYIGAATLGKPVELSLPDITVSNIGQKQGGVTPDQFAKAIIDAMVRSMGQAVADFAKSTTKSIGEGIKGLFGK